MRPRNDAAQVEGIAGVADARERPHLYDLHDLPARLAHPGHADPAVRQR